MPRLVSRTFDAIVRRSGLHHVGRVAQRRRLLIVCYHGVRADDDPERQWLLLPRREFADQIAYLAAHYECLPIDTALERLWAGELREPTACVTFDDGYRNNRTIALPILEQHRVPATIYLATGLIGTSELLWTTTIELAFRTTRVDSLDLAPLGISTERTPLGDARSRRAIGKRVVEALKLRPVAERRELMAAMLRSLDASANAAAFPQYALMDWNDVATVAQSKLVTFGGHTVHHEIVSRLDDATLHDEIAGSVAAVREHVAGAVSHTFAYPNGRPEDIDDRATRVLASVGCSAAVTTTEGLNAGSEPRMRLRRAVIGGDATMSGFAAQAAAVRSLVRGS